MPAKKGGKKKAGGKKAAGGNKKGGNGKPSTQDLNKMHGLSNPSSKTVAESARESIGADTKGNAVTMDQFWSSLLGARQEVGRVMVHELPPAQIEELPSEAVDEKMDEVAEEKDNEEAVNDVAEVENEVEVMSVIGIDEEEARVKAWYGKAEDYWASTDPSVDGMLGGLGELDKMDVAGSNAFLDSLKLEPRGKSGKGWVIADCGAGIGRVTRHLLAARACEMVLVEQHGPFLERAKAEFLGGPVADKVSEYVALGLQDWTPAKGKFDLIWVQWVANYLTDTDLVAFLKRAAEGLTPTGVICFKENTTNDDGSFVYDHDDSSVTRSDAHFRASFAESGLLLKSARLQTRFPSDLFPVRMYALVPADQAEKLAAAQAAKQAAAEAALMKSL